MLRLQVDPHLTGGVRADAAGKGRAVDLQGMVLDRPPGVGGSPGLLDLADIQGIEPDCAGGGFGALQGLSIQIGGGGGQASQQQASGRSGRHTGKVGHHGALLKVTKL